MKRASFYKRIQKPKVFNRRNRRGDAHRMSGVTPTRKEMKTMIEGWMGWISPSGNRME